MANNKTSNGPARREDWGTPRWLFDYLNGPASFNFAADLAAGPENKLCKMWVGTQENTLNLTPEDLFEMSKDYDVDLANRWCWINPPYGKSGLGRWGSVLTDLVPNIVALIPASVGARWFRPLWSHATAMVLISKRLRFEGAPTVAQFDSALFIKGDKLAFNQVSDLRRIGTVIIDAGIHPFRGELAWEEANLVSSVQ